MLYKIKYRLFVYYIFFQLLYYSKLRQINPNILCSFEKYASQTSINIDMINAENSHDLFEIKTYDHLTPWVLSKSV